MRRRAAGLPGRRIGPDGPRRPIGGTFRPRQATIAGVARASEDTGTAATQVLASSSALARQSERLNRGGEPLPRHGAGRLRRGSTRRPTKPAHACRTGCRIVVSLARSGTGTGLHACSEAEEDPASCTTIRDASLMSVTRPGARRAIGRRARRGAGLSPRRGPVDDHACLDMGSGPSLGDPQCPDVQQALATGAGTLLLSQQRACGPWTPGRTYVHALHCASPSQAFKQRPGSACARLKFR